jgi:hypothetical protein
MQHDMDTNRANAHLIAAAPDLLSLCEQVLQDGGDAHDGCDCTWCSYLHDALVDAIAKAKAHD